MAKAFVKTFKRDYARVNPLPDAVRVLRQLDSWFEHYNAVHPTANAVGAVRRPLDGNGSTEAIG